MVEALSWLKKKKKKAQLEKLKIRPTGFEPVT
jgi:hypothetical protein